MQHGRVYQFGSFRFDQADLLFRKGKRIHLTPKETSVLRLLLENAGGVVEKEDFRKGAWPEIHEEVEFDNCLKRAVATLRKALGENKRGRYISTISKRGYHFTGDVRVLSGRPPSSARRKTTLTVLPFGSLGSRKGPEYFIDGLTCEMITQLGRLNPEQLGVIAPRSALRYKQARGRKTIRKIARELGASYVVTGTVLWSRDQVRLSVQLIRASDEIQLWAETYQRRLHDILVFLREVCQDIARKIEIKLVPHEQARLDYLPPVEPEAYKSYLEGRYLWNKRTPEALQKAAILLKNAISRDSRFALAHSALADCYAVMASQSWIPPKQACDHARQAASTAMSIDRTFAEPHAALGFVLSVFERQWEDGEREFQEALRLNANCSTAHQWYSFCLAARGHVPEAVQQIRKAQEVDPLARMINTNVGTMLYWAGEYDAAIEQYDRALSLDADFWYAYWMRGMACDEKKQHHQAVADQKRAIEHFPGQSPLLTASLARSLALAGDHKNARRHLQQVDRLASHSFLPHYHIAMAYAALEDNDAAFEYLRDSCAAHEMWVSFIQVDPKTSALRHDARYPELRRALAL